MKKAKVKWQYQEGSTGLFFGNCSCCGEVVRRDAKGIDEECPGCGAELSWAEESEQEEDWRDWEDEEDI